ncbi:lipopolysaccharide biosynthesis protein [Halosimplex salinum]|uniref:lipopolysaccharide biosynthesis protein n=1 Tax=Halosimplex salinum TaxID=1710538 RepID=UPI000F4929B8|nr:lipopolysaccharide biosynthesis protein [Halosimplex salinum]
MAILESLKRLLSRSDSLGGKVVTGGIWSGILQGSNQVFRISVYVALARFLSPAGVGLIGLATLVYGLCVQLTDIGIKTSLIQRSEADVDDYLDTAWFLQVAKGAFLAAVLVGLSFVAPVVFGERQLGPMLQVFALIPLVNGIRNPAVLYFEKDLEFQKLFQYRFGETFVFGVVTVGLLLATPTVWAFVYGKVAGAVVGLAFSYGLHSFRPELTFTRAKAMEMIDYGKWIFGSSLLIYVVDKGDDLFLGWLLGTSSLGFYRAAYRFSNAPATQVSGALSKVFLPSFAELQDDVDSLRRAFYKSIRGVTLISFPMSLGIVAVTPVFVPVVLGAEWTPAIVTMQLLAVWGFVRATGSVFTPLFQAVGKPDVQTKLLVLRIALIAVAIYPLTDGYGIEGAAFVIVGTSLLTFPVGLYLCLDIVDGDAVVIGKRVAPQAVGSCIMAVAVWAVSGVLPVSVFGLIGQIATGVAVYAVVMAIQEATLGVGLKPLWDNLKVAAE